MTPVNKDKVVYRQPNQSPGAVPSQKNPEAAWIPILDKFRPQNPKPQVYHVEPFTHSHNTTPSTMEDSSTTTDFSTTFDDKSTMVPTSMTTLETFEEETSEISGRFKQSRKHISNRHSNILGGCEVNMEGLCVMRGDIGGGIRFKECNRGSPVIVEGKLEGLEAGDHTLIIHEFGEIHNRCKHIGLPYNPYRVSQNTH